MYCADITCTYKEMFSLKGTARHPGFIIHDVSFIVYPYCIPLTVRKLLGQNTSILESSSVFRPVRPKAHGQEEIPRTSRSSS